MRIDVRGREGGSCWSLYTSEALDDITRLCSTVAGLPSKGRNGKAWDSGEALIGLRELGLAYSLAPGGSLAVATVASHSTYGSQGSSQVWRF